MQEVKIAELKARLSYYLRLAENGEEVVVKDRDRPIARILASESSPARRLETIPRRLTHEQAKEILSKLPKHKLSRDMIDDTLRWMKEDRADRWFRKQRK
jgi:antitoxin (DNA-binding transcriptional repressor) of toxin-antitoxin stability system